MIGVLERTWLRVTLGVSILAALAIIDWRRNPTNPRRFKEYAFVIYAAAVATLYGVVHDQVTVSISPEYFLYGKGLVADGLPIRLSALLLGAQASYGVGAFAGVLLVVANMPRTRYRQLSYTELMRLAIVPVVGAAALALLYGFLYAFDVFGVSEQARPFVGAARLRSFLVVWGIHTGSYRGAAVGTLVSLMDVVIRRHARPDSSSAHA